jgi:hypothetical protein
MSQVFHVDADLVRAAGMEGAFDECADAGEFLEHAPGGAGGAAAAVEDGHFFAVDRVASDLVLDGAGARAGEMALDEGEIDLGDGTAGKLPGEMGMGGVGEGNDKAAAGVLVEAMDDPGALLAADAGEGGAVGEQGVDERVARVAGGGVDDEAGRLVEDEEIGVLEKDVEGDVLGLEEAGLGGGLGEGDERAGAELFAGLGRFSRERDVALLDEGLEAGAGEVGYFFCEEPVEPVSRGACIDSELEHLPE